MDATVYYLVCTADLTLPAHKSINDKYCMQHGVFTDPDQAMNLARSLAARGYDVQVFKNARVTTPFRWIGGDGPRRELIRPAPAA